ncbi:MAG TPA: HTH domain-containing protein [Saprospiraceae bacterium]|nr:HTH domain-containing protein [Saprospiraceae bacterium]
MKTEAPLKIIRIFKLLQNLSEFPPKNVEKLAQVIDVSPKTIYKDLHTLESLGYETDKDNSHRYQLKHHRQIEYHLDDTEKKLIIGLIKEAGLSTNTVTNITQKLKTNIYPDLVNYKIIRQLHIIRILLEATTHKMAVLLIDYQSTTPGSKKRNRHVLPIYFDEMKMNFTAFDLEKGQVQIYKVARMKDIQAANDVKYKIIPENLPMVDAFGFAGNMSFEVNVLLSKRAAAILTEEFTLIGQDITNNINEKFPYQLRSKVCGYEGVGRFVLGMLTEIKVVGDDGFKDYLKKKIAEMTII